MPSTQQLSNSVSVVLPSQPSLNDSTTGTTTGTTTPTPTNPQFTLLEGALWHTQLNKLLFIDIEQPSVHTYDPSTNEHKRYPIGGAIGTVVTTSNPSLLLCATQSGPDRGISMLDLNTGGESPYVAHPDWSAKDTRRFNDGKVSPDGKLYVGTMVLDEVKPRTPDAALYVVKPKDEHRGTIEQVFDGVTISNGTYDITCHTINITHINIAR